MPAKKLKITANSLSNCTLFCGNSIWEPRREEGWKNRHDKKRKQKRERKERKGNFFGMVLFPLLLCWCGAGCPSWVALPSFRTWSIEHQQPTNQP